MQANLLVQYYADRYRTPFFLVVFFMIGSVLGYIVHSEHLVLFINMLATFYYFILSKNIRIIILFLAVFFPLAFGDLGPVEEFLWIEWMAPLFLIFVLYSIITKQSSFVIGKGNLFFIALLFLILATVINYVKNPVTSHELFGASESQSGIRSYYTIFIGVCLFIIGYWLLLNDYVNFQTILILFIWISLAAGILRVFSYFLDFDTPLFYSEFHYAPPPTEYGGSIAHRIGGLDRVTWIGLPAVFAYYHKKQWSVGAIFLVITFFILMFLGGGRAIFLGIGFAAVVYFAWLHKQRIGLMLFLVMLLFVVFRAATSILPVPDQFNRIFSYEGGLIQQSLPRSYLFNYYIESFLSSPMWGKGIGYAEVGVQGEYLSKFVTTNLMIGGHGAYLSIVAIFGLCGVFFLFVFLFGSIFYHLGYLKMAATTNAPAHCDLSLFILLSLLIRTAIYVVSWSGFNDLSLYLLAGLTAALFTQTRRAGESAHEHVKAA